MGQLKHGLHMLAITKVRRYTDVQNGGFSVQSTNMLARLTGQGKNKCTLQRPERGLLGSCSEMAMSVQCWVRNI
jgi:hypothetical protein